MARYVNCVGKNLSLGILFECLSVGFHSLSAYLFLVTGSEDMSVYLYNIDECHKPLNTLLGHSSPVLDVCWNYDESLLASCDLEVSHVGPGR